MILSIRGDTLLFSTEPKDSIDELFDRKNEIEKFKANINERMVLILGLRRIGKSSLVLSTLNSLPKDYIFIDVRKIYDDTSKKVLVEKLYEEIRSSLSKLSRKEYIKSIISRFNISLDFSLGVKFSIKEMKENITNIFNALNEVGEKSGSIPIVFDEAQYLRYSTVGLRSLFAHVYDYMKGVTLIFTGSEVGLLQDFLGIDDPKSELYGRYYSSVELKPFDPDTSKKFLRTGFKELNVKVGDSIIEKAVNELDGIVGWLVYFGKLYLEKGNDALEEVKILGSKLVRKELEEAFSKSPYYLYIMKAIATLGNARWKNILNFTIAETGKKIANATISRDIQNLIKMGFIEKENNEYKISDPIVRYTVLEEF